MHYAKWFILSKQHATSCSSFTRTVLASYLHTAAKTDRNHSEYYTYNFSSNERTTTDTDDAAIAADAIHGFSTKPTGLNTPVNTSRVC